MFSLAKSSCSNIPSNNSNVRAQRYIRRLQKKKKRNEKLSRMERYVLEAITYMEKVKHHKEREKKLNSYKTIWKNLKCLLKRKKSIRLNKINTPSRTSMFRDMTMYYLDQLIHNAEQLPEQTLIEYQNYVLSSIQDYLREDEKNNCK